jgi:hypothetical protein
MDTAGAQFLGNPFPTRELSFQTNVTVWKNFRLSGLLDYRGGFHQYNATEQFRCTSFNNCESGYAGFAGIEAPLAAQAATIASQTYGSQAGYIEEADFVKLREIALTIGLPENLARRLRSQGVSLTLAGRNLKTWTDYSGIDPEINFNGSGSNFSTAEFLTQPPVRYWTARIDVNF